MQVFGLCEAAGGGEGVQGKTGLVHMPEADSVAATTQHASNGFQHWRLRVVVLAPATAVQLDVGACRLAVASGAEEATPRT